MNQEELASLQVSISEALKTATREAQSKKDVTKLPEYHGDPAKDKMSASAFVRRVEMAGRAAKWTPGETVTHMRLALTGKAEEWFEVEIDRTEVGWEENFDMVSTSLIMRFEPGALSPKAVRVLSDLGQQPSDGVADFGDRLKRYAIQWRRTLRVPSSMNTEEVRTACRIGMRLAYEQVIHTLFLLGLKEKVKKSVCKKAPSDFEEALGLALDYEIGLNNIKGHGEDTKGTKISPVTVESRPETERNKEVPTCQYCDKKGHVTKTCFQFKRDRNQDRNRDGTYKGSKGKQKKTFKKKMTSAMNQSDSDTDDSSEDEEDKAVSAVKKNKKNKTLNFLGIA